MITVVLATSVIPVSARWEDTLSSWDDVPVDRLLTNLKAREDKLWFWQNADRANLEFQIGRLHSMAFAQKSETGKIKKGVGPETALPFPQPAIPDFSQPKVVRSPTDETAAIATKHLEKAILHLDKAVTLDPSLIAARLGLAWCEDQAGNKQRAITLYREVFGPGLPNRRGTTNQTGGNVSDR